jgi:hypothetical protein
MALAVIASQGFAQDDAEPTLQQLVADHTHRITLDRGRLDGPGASFLRQRIDGTSFFLVGEQHATADLAHLEMALWNEAHDRGYEYHAVEIGPIGTEEIESLLRSAGPQALRAYQLEADNLLTFPFVFFEEEARLVQAVVQDSRDETRALWGLDQEFIAGGRVVLDRLADLADTEAQHAAVAEARKQAAADLMWLGMSPPETFAPLQEAFADHPAGRAIIDDLVLSNAIYAPFTGRGGSVYTANDIRERTMKQNFLRYYREAQARTGQTPRVFLKFGANHLAAGHSPTHVVTLGTFLLDLALMEGLETFSLHLDCQGGWVRDPRSGETSDCSSYFLGEGSDLAAVLPEDRMAILDLKGLRPHMKRFKDWDEQSRQLLLAYDAVLFVRDVGPATLPSR